jgi:hypothetical protein
VYNWALKKLELLALNPSHEISTDLIYEVFKYIGKDNPVDPYKMAELRIPFFERICRDFKKALGVSDARSDVEKVMIPPAFDNNLEWVHRSTMPALVEYLNEKGLGCDMRFFKMK